MTLEASPLSIQRNNRHLGERPSRSPGSSPCPSRISLARSTFPERARRTTALFKKTRSPVVE